MKQFSTHDGIDARNDLNQFYKQLLFLELQTICKQEWEQFIP